MALVRKETYYELLGLERLASELEIFEQYKSLSAFWKDLSLESPVEAGLKLLELNTALLILTDIQARLEYDESLDFEFVLLDGKTQDPEMEEAYETYRHNHRKSYQEVLQDFSLFKNDLGDTLWMLKSTTMYLVISLFLYSGFILVGTLLFQNFISIPEKVHPLRTFFIPIYVVLSSLGYLVLKKFYLLPRLRKRKNKS